ncbi:hypothetical protein PVAND_002093 [Polypedilum vanderplanki]|uniref:Uncharacterized protein n=1 Tax=Polypedilum vanderplanki TaxID=319348 RepID=A0A9J6BQG8_POLVA|nr:hypothetical protein PVAND_002093 [Polypedilum vanderplanki]
MQSFSNFSQNNQSNSIPIILSYLSIMSLNFELSVQTGKVISRAIDEIFLKDNIEFNILMSKTQNHHLQLILAEILKNTRENFKVKIFNTSPNSEKLSTLFILNNHTELTIAEDYIKAMKTNYSTAHKYIIYCADINYTNIFMHYRPSLMLDRRSWIDYMDKYYIINIPQGFSLMTYFVRSKSNNEFELKLENVNMYVP